MEEVEAGLGEILPPTTWTEGLLLFFSVRGEGVEEEKAEVAGGEEEHGEREMEGVWRVEDGVEEEAGREGLEEGEIMVVPPLGEQWVTWIVVSERVFFSTPCSSSSSISVSSSSSPSGSSPFSSISPRRGVG